MDNTVFHRYSIRPRKVDSVFLILSISLELTDHDRACGGGGPQIRRGASVSILGNVSTIQVSQNGLVLASRNRSCTMRRSVCWSAAAYVLAAVLMMSIRTASDGGPERCCTPWCLLGGAVHGLASTAKCLWAHWPCCKSHTNYCPRTTPIWWRSRCSRRWTSLAAATKVSLRCPSASANGAVLQVPRWERVWQNCVQWGFDILPDVRACICTTPADVNRGTESVATDDGCGMHETLHCQCTCSALAARLR